MPSEQTNVEADRHAGGLYIREVGWHTPVETALRAWPDAVCLASLGSDIRALRGHRVPCEQDRHFRITLVVKRLP